MTTRKHVSPLEAIWLVACKTCYLTHAELFQIMAKLVNRLKDTWIFLGGQVEIDKNEKLHWDCVMIPTKYVMEAV